MRDFYPAIEPYQSGYLKVSDLHEVYFEQSGNPDGAPVIFLHGGPGGGTDPDHRRYFNPEKYRIILFDQRGCGKSKPHAELRENTTWDLVADIERFREHLKINKWLVFGGSWGSTLALSYAITHTDRVKGLVLRGIFLCRREELLWFYQEGASWLFPDQFERYRDYIPAPERKDMMAAYYKRLTDPKAEIRLEAARIWSQWEAATSKLFVDPKMIDAFGEPEKALAFARIECHYFMNNAFFPTPNYLLEQAPKLAKIPGVIVQGRYDVVCPVKSAWDLHRAWPTAEVKIIPDAGHAASEPGIRSALIQATDNMSTL
ncbi:MAG: prolyl aminopeptidase [Bdellovibrionales bacterium]